MTCLYARMEETKKKKISDENRDVISNILKGKQLF